MRIKFIRSGFWVFALISGLCPAVADSAPPAKSDTASSPSTIVPTKLDPSKPHILIYPPIATWNEQQGTVVVDVAVGSDGWVRDARIVTSSGYQQLDAAALVTVGYWHYLPETRDGVAVASAHRTQLIFNLNFGNSNARWMVRPEPPPPLSNDLKDVAVDTSHFVLYPQMARRSAQSGDVTLNILVRGEGYVSDALVVRSSGFSQLDSAALISAGYWDFLPATKNGSPIDAWKTVRVHLAPPDSGPESPNDEFGPNLPSVFAGNRNGVSRSPGIMDGENQSGQPASAAPTPPEVPRSSIEYPSVDVALAALHSKPGVVFTTKDDGWTNADDPATRTTWLFSPKSSPAYPAMVKRQVVVKDGATVLKTSMICEATKDACDDLARTIQKLNADVAAKMHQ